MDLKKLQKEKIINDVFKGYEDTDWSVLVYDKSTAKVMTNLFTQSELITHNIVLAQRIEEKRENADFPVVYFVLCTKDNSTIINKEFESKKYSSFRVCCLNTPENLNPMIPTSQIFMNYFAIEDKLFISSIPDIYSVANTININLNVEYTLKSLEHECRKLDDQSNNDQSNNCTNNNTNEKLNGKVFIFDRSIDLYSPLAHFFNFQALLEDLEITDMKKIYDEFGDTHLWKEVRYAHLGELNDVFKTYAHDISSNMKKLEGDIDTKELMKMVLSAPETLKMNEMLKKFFDLAGQCYEAFDYISIFNEIEQTIMTGINKNNINIYEKIIEVFENKNVDHLDKLRLFYLYKFSIDQEQFDLFMRDNKKTLSEVLKRDGGDTNGVHHNGDTLSFFKPLKYNYKYDYDVSRYEPTISVVLREYLVNKKKLTEFFRLKRETVQFKSLRKSYLLSVKNTNKKKVYIVYIRGGVTYPEIASIQKLTDILGVEILVGSDKILRAKEFVQGLCKGSE